MDKNRMNEILSEVNNRTDLEHYQITGRTPLTSAFIICDCKEKDYFEFTEQYNNKVIQFEKLIDLLPKDEKTEILISDEIDKLVKLIDRQTAKKYKKYFTKVKERLEIHLTKFESPSQPPQGENKTKRKALYYAYLYECKQLKIINKQKELYDIAIKEKVSKHNFYQQFILFTNPKENNRINPNNLNDLKAVLIDLQDYPQALIMAQNEINEIQKIL